ncbi:GlsB/YeaQ/YmgE family stress response membrane protein [Plantactinospora sp. GCM10030261]|uniref:GlsB/YeaQ/YmgE family stress response membrane protein n=1 Tax=Plantactinospora sp. GCM10030261 TaxID=3273420 RepID=UPI00361D74D5
MHIPEEEGDMTLWGIIMALVVGLIVGALGRLIVPGKQNMPMWLHMVIGVGAALLGTVIARAAGIATETAGIDWRELAIQVVLAAIAVAVVAGVGGRRRVSRY